MTKGYGSIFQEPHTRLSTDELSLLKLMLETPSVQQRKPSRLWSNSTIKISERYWEVRTTQSVISNLHGLDLIKGGRKSKYWTEEENQLVKYTESSPEYWVGSQGEPVYNRAKFAIENNGNISEFFSDMKWCFSLDLYPYDERFKIVLNGKISRYGNENLELECDRIAEIEKRAILNDLMKKTTVIKIVLETHDEQPKLKSRYDVSKESGTL